MVFPANTAEQCRATLERETIAQIVAREENRGATQGDTSTTGTGCGQEMRAPLYSTTLQCSGV